MPPAFPRYVLVGGTALLLHLAVIHALLAAAACDAWLASAIGFVLACAFNYAMQHVWVFRSTRPHAATLPRYFAVTGLMLCVNTALFTALYRAEIPPLAAQILTTGGVFVLNFLANRRFTFGGGYSPIA